MERLCNYFNLMVEVAIKYSYSPAMIEQCKTQAYGALCFYQHCAILDGVPSAEWEEAEKVWREEYEPRLNALLGEAS